MMQLKLACLGLHSLKGGSPNELPPLRRRGYQRTCYSIPPPQRQWRKRDHGSFKRKPPETEGYPKVFYPRDPITAQIQRPVVSYLPIISTGLSFLFRSPEPLFLLQAKEKVVLAPAGQAEKQSPAGQAKTICKIKPSRFLTKEKTISPARGANPRRDTPLILTKNRLQMQAVYAAPKLAYASLFSFRVMPLFLWAALFLCRMP